MGKLLEQSWFRGFVSAVIVAGILITLVAVFQFVDANNQLQDNIAHQTRGEEIQLDSEAQATSLMTADIERRKLESQKDDAMIIGGIGLVVIAVGWIFLDFSRGHARKQEAQQANNNAEASAV